MSDTQSIDQKLDSALAELAAVKSELAYVSNIMKAIVSGIEGMSVATGPSAMMMRSLGLPIDQINDGVQQAQALRSVG